MNERLIFAAALDLADPAARAAYLDEACGPDAALRRHIEELLAAQEKLGSFLATPAGGTAAYEPVGEGPGARVGPYKLLQPIGEGGMGAVWMAEQQEPVRRKVALKIIKPGMDSQQVIARFEAERQALALMDHLHIAKVLDAGTTDTGRPYFVMELVHGVPITTFCDDRRLTPRERLALFVPVCQAIQHAHTKGVIHRDVKPSNVLVTMYDDKPVPKVIDFGVAKATEQRLTERTLFTQFGALVGTFEYMSPEQAEMNALGVDTRSDVYSLGVLLYELLTGTTPLERKRLREAAVDEVVRLIKEEEPPRPSVRLSSSDTLPKIAAARKTEPARLSKLVRGELDWIVMKCLEKDRARRYETASALAADVRRFLGEEAVEARPPTAWYRFRKLARRNRVALTTAALVAAALVAGTAVATWQAVRAKQAEQDARAAERTAQARLAEVLEQTARAEAASTQAEDEAAMVSALREVLGEMLGGNLGKDVTRTLREGLDRAARQLGQSHLTSPRAEAPFRDILGYLYFELGAPAEASPHALRSLQLHRERFKVDCLGTTLLLEAIVDAHAGRGEWDRAEALVSEWVRVLRRFLPPGHPQVAYVSARGGLVRLRRGDHAGAEAVLRASLKDLHQEAASERHRERVRYWLGQALAGQKRFAEAEPLLLQWHQRLKEWEKGFLPGLVRPEIPEAVQSLAVLYDAWGKPDEAAKWRKKLKAVRPPRKGDGR